MEENDNAPKKKRGAQPGNRNSRTHGHEKRLSPEDQRIIQAAAGESNSTMK